MKIKYIIIITVLLFLSTKIDLKAQSKKAESQKIETINIPILEPIEKRKKTSANFNSATTKKVEFLEYQKIETINIPILETTEKRKKTSANFNSATTEEAESQEIEKIILIKQNLSFIKPN